MYSYFLTEKSAKDAIELVQPGKKFRAWLDDIGHKIMAFPKLKGKCNNQIGFECPLCQGPLQTSVHFLYTYIVT